MKTDIFGRLKSYLYLYLSFLLQLHLLLFPSSHSSFDSLHKPRGGCNRPVTVRSFIHSKDMERSELISSEVK